MNRQNGLDRESAGGTSAVFPCIDHPFQVMGSESDDANP